MFIFFLISVAGWTVSGILPMIIIAWIERETVRGSDVISASAVGPITILFFIIFLSEKITDVFKDKTLIDFSKRK